MSEHTITPLKGGEKMEFAIESVEEVSPKHPIICASKPSKAMAPTVI